MATAAGPDSIKPEFLSAGPSTTGKQLSYSSEISSGPVTQSATAIEYVKNPRKHDKERKIGHRRVDDTGNVTYKKKPTSELMAAMQLGIARTIGSLANKQARDLLIQDFDMVESVVYPREGSNLTPAHHFSDFRFKTYAPIAFRYFRELFQIKPEDFLLSLCNEPMKELSNPGASGSIFYLTEDDEFIVKTVQHNEAEFLQKLLPGYYMNLNQNPRTLLPKFYGLYTYQCGGKNIRFVIMNNLLPSNITYHEKYDLKGSTYKRKASKHERSKSSPTLKDLDFLELHPSGILLEPDTYTALTKTIERDCRVLQSFKIMDYSLLVGVHNLDQALLERQERQAQVESESKSSGDTPPVVDPNVADAPNFVRGTVEGMSRGRSQRQRLAQYSTAMEAIQANTAPLELDTEDIPPGGIPARNAKGERLMIYLGIIDILQSYRFRKKLEHAMKSVVHDGDTISVHKPGFYAQRFQDFFSQKVFHKISSPMKQSPTKKRANTLGGPGKVFAGDIEGAVGGRPDLLPENTPRSSYTTLPPHMRLEGGPTYHSDLLPGAHATTETGHPKSEPLPSPKSRQRLEFVSQKDTAEDQILRNIDAEPGPSTSQAERPSPLPIHRLSSPSHSASTPTYTERTEGTPSYTESSLSGSSEALGPQSPWKSPTRSTPADGQQTSSYLPAWQEQGDGPAPAEEESKKPEIEDDVVTHL